MRLEITGGIGGSTRACLSSDSLSLMSYPETILTRSPRMMYYIQRYLPSVSSFAHIYTRACRTSDTYVTYNTCTNIYIYTYRLYNEKERKMPTPTANATAISSLISRSYVYTALIDITRGGGDGLFTAYTLSRTETEFLSPTVASYILY